jgi:hypothetical protein
MRGGASEVLGSQNMGLCLGPFRSALGRLFQRSLPRDHLWGQGSGVYLSTTPDSFSFLFYLPFYLLPALPLMAS